MSAHFKMMLRNSPESKLLIAVVVLVVLTIALSVYAHLLPYLPGDLNITLLVQSLDSDMILSVMKWVSFAFEGWRAYALVAVISLIVWRSLGKSKAALVVSAGLSTLLVAALKIVVDRPRPTADLIKVWEIEQDKSFPSGHAFYVMVVLGLAAYFVFTYVRSPRLRIGITAGLITLIILIGASRVYLGAHWPSDVLGGYLAGAAVLGMLIWLDKTFTKKDTEDITEQNPPNPP